MKRLKQTFINYSSPRYYYFLKYIGEFARKCGSIPLMVDIGCGSAPYREIFSPQKIVLVDIEKRGEVDLLCDVQNLAIKNMRVDLVLLTEVLEHVKDERKGLSEIYRTLRSGGLLIISVPFLLGVHEAIDYRRWTARGFREQLQQHGFEIEDFQKMGGFFSSLLCLWRNMPKELLGGDFQSLTAKLLFPLIGINFFICMLLTPVAVLFDKFDKNKFSSIGYVVLCRKL